MGIGDNIMASGLARGARARGKRMAFGDGQRIIWDQNSEQVFRNNPNIATPGSEQRGDLEWMAFYKGHRIYNKQGDGRWIWNYQWRPKPGQLFFSIQEKARAHQWRLSRFVVMEPNVVQWKTVAPNKQWPVERYQEVSDRLRERGFRVIQFENREFPGYRLRHADHVRTENYRHAASILAHAVLYVGSEGGLHHGAAALDVPGVVLFGGFVPPEVTGYPTHTNLTGGAEACGSLKACEHCRAAMDAISAEEVLAAALARLSA